MNGLRTESLTVSFGGLVAVDDLTIDAPLGRITGLIGPNGAGKSTTFNACNGMVKSRTGRVELFGDDVTALAPSSRAQRGLGRTFQRMELFDSMTVAQNVALGRSAHFAGARLLGQLRTSRHEREVVREATASALARCGLESLRDRAAGGLTTGQRRLVELARVLAGPFRMLLLDEPSSGLDDRETERFGDVLEAVLAEREIGILLVEHDMNLVHRVCAYVFVLDFGQLIFEGTMAEVAASDIVRAAYLGSTEVVA